MSKLSLEKKVEIVNYYMTTSDGYINTAKKFGISGSTVGRFILRIIK